ncbi:TIGR03089 family protein [Corynebacterium qintianiae]|uniref:TIGR03089 family protein n=1 Tax=Corynebacterium qintianiae TaxID=2709392 RepID=A0A7T0KP75_9CORY|nr:TIGR03089 family protein [Corynebacterium qintianiae]QPK83689.1 TIGR03089 family protein [Corynebacterium qintianiae]
MSIMAPLLASNPSSPRLTVYDEADGTRMEFSALTLDNWASKIANMVEEEFELAPDAAVLIDLPASWQAAVIALGTFNSSRTPLFDAPSDATPAIVFTTTGNASRWSHVTDVVVVSPDPFGRGVVESGGELPPGTVDFGPTVRFYGDIYSGDTPSLDNWSDPTLGAHRYLVDPWRVTGDVEKRILAPLAADGSVVVATGLVSADRLQDIAEAENVTHFLTAD